ncbi:hypothetical protein N7468_010024 [Penicillium chermesinum]|uniref:Rhodopsin domain-containing protein n=1 Tax=Penicillium chermesinum TaxID=63820 RepID=A0A9W9NBV8_9EURO|nr:uncharacterized protein N7468_010024 [Penicillium chermesinum]KAJ5217016.1 hypothetical protein N7468_010024 [Penicillium chermesinum]
MSDRSKYKPAPGSADFESQVARWGNDVRVAQYVGIIICTVAPTVAVGLRLYARHLYRTKFGLDDIFIIIALLIVIAETVSSCLSLRAGAGLHQVRVMYEDRDPPHALVYLYTNYWIVSVLWAPGVMFIKMSILVLYRRLFLVQQRWFKIALWVNMAYAVGLGISGTFVFIFQCWPVQYYWTRTVSYYGLTPPQGSCIPLLAHLATPQFLNTASDIAILILPLPIIWNLQIEKARKVAVSGVFLLGCFTVGCGIARIAVIFEVTNSDDVTVNNLETVTFTVVEAGVGIVCACLPPIAPLYASMMQRWGLMTSDPEYSKESAYHAATVWSRPAQHTCRASRIRSITGSLADDKDGVEFQNLVPVRKDTKHPALQSIGESKSDVQVHEGFEARVVEPGQIHMRSSALPAYGEAARHAHAPSLDDIVPEYLEIDHR